MKEIGYQIAAREDMLAAPEVTHGIYHLMATAAHDSVVGISEVFGFFQRSGDGIAFGSRTFQHEIDRGRNKFHMA